MCARDDYVCTARVWELSVRAGACVSACAGAYVTTMYVTRARGFRPYKGATRPSAWVGVGERVERGERVSAYKVSVRQHGKERDKRKRERDKRREPKHHQHKLKRKPTDRPTDRPASKFDRWFPLQSLAAPK